MAQERAGDRGERFGMPTLEGMGAIARKLDCSVKSVLRRSRDRIDPLWILRDPFGKRYAFLGAIEAWVHRQTLAIQTVEQIERLAVKARGKQGASGNQPETVQPAANPASRRSPAPVKTSGGPRQRSRLQ